MRYATPAAFRTALEARLNEAARARGQGSPARLRKLVVVDRLLARLQVVAPGRWVVKGGVALDLRLGDRARATNDLDLTWPDPRETTTAHLIAAATLALDDGFDFTIERINEPAPEGETDLSRYRVTAELAGRRFETMTLDIGGDDPLPAAPDLIASLDLLGFAGVAGVTVPVVPLATQLAEKVHASTATYGGGRASSRVKDLIDIVLIADLGELQAGPARTVLAETFGRRATHALPATFPKPPTGWTVAYRRLALELDLEPELDAGHQLAAALLDPLLAGQLADTDRWDPAGARWSAPEHRGDPENGEAVA